MSRFELVFTTEPDEHLVKMLSEGYVDYDFLGKLDILIEGRSFLKNFKPEDYDRHYEGTRLKSISFSFKGYTEKKYESCLNGFCYGEHN